MKLFQRVSLALLAAAIELPVMAADAPKAKAHLAVVSVSGYVKICPSSNLSPIKGSHAHGVIYFVARDGEVYSDLFAR